jgi:hypothetical protein
VRYYDEYSKFTREVVVTDGDGTLERRATKIAVHRTGEAGAAGGADVQLGADRDPFGNGSDRFCRENVAGGFPRVSVRGMRDVARRLQIHAMVHSDPLARSSTGCLIFV